MNRKYTVWHIISWAEEVFHHYPRVLWRMENGGTTMMSHKWSIKRNQALARLVARAPVTDRRRDESVTP